jgi:hypothetical protein
MIDLFPYLHTQFNINLIIMNFLKFTTSHFVVALLVVSALFISSCSKKILFVTNKNVPAARGFVKVKTDGNNNYSITIKLENLAEVERLLENKKTYVVWMQTKDITAVNIGQISSSTGIFSNNLKADFKTVSAMKPTKIFISAEENGAVSTPGYLVVLSTENF